MKTKTLLTAIVLSIILAACVPKSTPVVATDTPESNATAMPIPATPSLEHAVNFEKGVSNIPKGYYIFIEFRGSSVCSDECQCAPAPIQPRYGFTSTGELWVDLEGLTTPLSSPTVGFLGFHDWREQVYVMDTLPFALSPSDTTVATVYSVNADGTAVVEVYGETYFIKPGQAWADSGDMKQESPAGCHISYSTSLTNFGLYSQTQIRFGNPDLHP